MYSKCKENPGIRTIAQIEMLRNVCQHVEENGGQGDGGMLNNQFDITIIMSWLGNFTDTLVKVSGKN